MNYSKQCDCCGHIVTAYTIHLNEPLVRAFLTFAAARIRLGRPVKKCEIELDHSGYGNFQKLRHFHLIEKRDAGAWEMTVIGWSFIMGTGSVITPAAQFGNSTLGYDHEAWKTHKDGHRSVSIRDVLPADWKDRAAYMAEKAGAA